MWSGIGKKNGMISQHMQTVHNDCGYFFYFLEDSPDGKIIAVIVAMDSR